MSDTKSNLQKVIDHLAEELNRIHTSRVSPSVVENIEAEAYGAKTPLSQLASITNQGPRVLVIQPWDQSVLKDVEKAITVSDVDVNPAVDKNVIRLNFPPLTEEKRKEIVKVLNEKVENAKVSLRKTREEYLKEIKDKEKNKEISEDEYFNLEKEYQKEIDEFNQKIKEMAESKEEEVMTV